MLKKMDVIAPLATIITFVKSYSYNEQTATLKYRKARFIPIQILQTKSWILPRIKS